MSLVEVALQPYLGLTLPGAGLLKWLVRSPVLPALSTRSAGIGGAATVLVVLVEIGVGGLLLLGAWPVPTARAGAALFTAFAGYKFYLVARYRRDALCACLG